MRIPPGNIYSGDRIRAVFTNPTELAFRKGNVRNHYPITVNGKMFADVEAWYQHAKRNSGHMDFSELQDLLVQGIKIKLLTYPEIVEAIDDSGGEEWIRQCSHFTGARTAGYKRWEGRGGESAFIRCLLRAYQEIKEG
jgi:hypothetical protein